MQGDTGWLSEAMGQSMASIGGLAPVMVLVDARGVKARRVVAMDFEALGGCSLEYAYVTDS
jgi:hypothetical protein